MDKLDLRDLDLQEMQALVGHLGTQPYRARQLFAWVHRRGAVHWEEMTDLPRNLREALAEASYVSSPEAERQLTSSDGQTFKYLLRFSDGKAAETVLMIFSRRKARNRVTACISSQIGCALACRFCATGALGFERNLRPAELVGQVYFWNRLLRKRNLAVTNVVYMGMGEPLLNYEAVVKSIRLLSHPEGLNLGQRRLTVSTCGIVPGIRRLAREGLSVRLAVSLHATEDELRSRLLPINRRYPLTDLLAACREYAQFTGRKITFAYLLLAGVNDTLRDAERLGRLLAGIPSQVNLITYNQVEEKEFRSPSPSSIRRFMQRLIDQGVEVSLRERRGKDIEAACGQLRGRGPRRAIT
ncbi:MAG: 23S rRNA (adenine(2503)-C(2))-methyltransferase RlmN [Moorellales bacterium]